ncbi:MAG: hypothetical protein ABRQ37_15380 [Candidatus Eremiobacterota bacterium]
MVFYQENRQILALPGRKFAIIIKTLYNIIEINGIESAKQAVSYQL